MGLLLILPVYSSNTLLHYALDLLEHVGVFFIDPVSQVSTVIQDLTDNQRCRVKDWFRDDVENKKRKDDCENRNEPDTGTEWQITSTA